MATLFPESREKDTPREREVGAMLEKIAQDFNSSINYQRYSSVKYVKEGEMFFFSAG